MITPVSHLAELNACSEAVRYAEQHPDLETAWAKCERGDWMLWYAGKKSGDIGSLGRRKLVGAAAECARLALPIFEKRYPDDKRVRECIEACEGYARGEVSDSELRRARIDAAAYAVAYAAADRKKILADCAKIVRKHYPTLP